MINKIVPINSFKNFSDIATIIRLKQRGDSLETKKESSCCTSFFKICCFPFTLLFRLIKSFGEWLDQRIFKAKAKSTTSLKDVEIYTPQDFKPLPQMPNITKPPIFESHKGTPEDLISNPKWKKENFLLVLDISLASSTLKLRENLNALSYLLKKNAWSLYCGQPNLYLKEENPLLCPFILTKSIDIEESKKKFIFQSSIYSNVNGQKVAALKETIRLQLFAAFKQKHEALLIPLESTPSSALIKALYTQLIEEEFAGAFKKIVWLEMPAFEKPYPNEPVCSNIHTLNEIKK